MTTKIGKRFAPKGKVWVCCACGKTEKDLYGSTRGWDESCMLNAVMVDEDRLVLSSDGKRVVRIRE